ISDCAALSVQWPVNWARSSVAHAVPLSKNANMSANRKYERTTRLMLEETPRTAPKFHHSPSLLGRLPLPRLLARQQNHSHRFCLRCALHQSDGLCVGVGSHLVRHRQLAQKVIPRIKRLMGLFIGRSKGFFELLTEPRCQRISHLKAGAGEPRF